MKVTVLRCCLFLAGTLGVRAEVPVPPGGTELTAGAALKVHADPAHATVSQLEGGGWKIEVTRPDEARSFLAQVSVPFPDAPLVPGETVLALIQARAAAGAGASVEAKLQGAGPPYTMAADTTRLNLTADFQELPVVFRITTAIEKGQAALNLLCAGQLQAVEVSAIRAYRFPAGTDTSAFPRIRRSYPGREADAAWRKAALERIEQHRKADLSVRIHGSDGKPLAATEVVLTLRRHEFGFGSAVTADLLTADSEDAKRYREIVDRLFSRVVFENDLKDVGWEPAAAGKDEKRRKLDQAFGWLGERHVSVRGHYLMQVAVPPNLADVTDAEAIRKHFLDTARERLEFAADRVCEWDVINHPVAWSGAELFSKRPGLEKLDREIYGLAQRTTALPFFVNEDQLFRPGRQADETFAYVEALKREGFRIDGIGNQAHFDESFLPSPKHLLAVTDRFAALAPRQVISEFDIVTQADEELAADYTRDAMIACFSHPAYTGFLLWGFWEGSHWKPEAASWNRDWTIRKRGEVLEEWLGRRWVTREEQRTGKGGLIRWRGFPGWYEARTKSGQSAGMFLVTKAVPSATVELR